MSQNVKKFNEYVCICKGLDVIIIDQYKTLQRASPTLVLDSCQWPIWFGCVETNKNGFSAHFSDLVSIFDVLELVFKSYFSEESFSEAKITIYAVHGNTLTLATLLPPHLAAPISLLLL